MGKSYKKRPEQEYGCKTTGLDSSITLRVPAAQKIQWQARADARGLDLGELIRRIMEDEKIPSNTEIRNDNQRHLQRMALWTVQCLVDLREKVDQSPTIDQSLADEIAVYLGTLLSLFDAVAAGEIDVTTLSSSPDASEKQAGGL